MSDPHPPVMLPPGLLGRVEALAAELEPLVDRQEARLRAVPSEDRPHAAEARDRLEDLLLARRALVDLLGCLALIHADPPGPATTNPAHQTELEAALVAMREGWSWSDAPATRVFGEEVLLAVNGPVHWGPPQLLVYHAEDVVEAHRRQLEREAELGRPLTPQEALAHWEAFEEREGGLAAAAEPEAPRGRRPEEVVFVPEVDFEYELLAPRTPDAVAWLRGRASRVLVGGEHVPLALEVVPLEATQLVVVPGQAEALPGQALVTLLESDGRPRFVVGRRLGQGRGNGPDLERGGTPDSGERVGPTRPELGRAGHGVH